MSLKFSRFPHLEVCRTAYGRAPDINHVRSKEQTVLVQVVTFNLEGMSDAEFRTWCDEQLAPAVASMPGVSKTWLADPATNTYGGIYVWPDREAMERYAATDLFKAFVSDQRIVDIKSEVFDVLEAPTRATNGLCVLVA